MKNKTEEQTYSVQITPTSYSEKPGGDEAKTIQVVISNKRLTGTKDEIAHHLVNGYGVTLGLLEKGVRNNDTNVEHNEVLMLDFDNDPKMLDENGKRVTDWSKVDPDLIEHVLDNKWIQSAVAFIYETFSSTPEQPRFRAVIFPKEPVAAKDVKNSYAHMFDMLKEFDILLDKTATNPSRLFYGSQIGSYIEVNMGNTWLARQKEPVYIPAGQVASDEEAIEYNEGYNIMEAFVEVMHYELVEDPNAQNNYVRDLFHLYGNYNAGIISEEQALDYSELLAAGHDEWAEQNRTRMEGLIKKGEDEITFKPFREAFQKKVALKDPTSEIAADYRQRENDGMTDEQIEALRENVVKNKVKPAQMNGKPVALKEINPDGTVTQKYENLTVLRDAKGQVLNVTSNIEMGDKITRYDELADVTNEVSKANYVMQDLYVKPLGNPFWTSDSNIVKRTLSSIVGRLMIGQTKEVLEQMTLTSTNYGMRADRVQLKNNHHLVDGVVKENWTNLFTPFYLNVNYDPNAYSKDVDDFLDFLSAGDESMRLLFEELIGHMLLRRNKDAIIFFLADVTQKGGTGKSTLGTMLTNFVEGSSKTKEDYEEELKEDVYVAELMPNSIEKPRMAANINVKNFSDDTTALSLANRISNFGDETPMDMLKQTDTIKSLASGGNIEKRGAYKKDPIMVNTTATLMFATNEMPLMTDQSGGIGRRLCIIPFDRKPIEAGIPENVQLDLLLSTPEAQSYILNLGIKGVESMKQNNRKVHIPLKVQELNVKYMTNNDPVAQYINDVNNMTESELRHYGKLTNRDIRVVYKSFSDWSTASGYPLRTIRTFETRMRALGYDTVRSSSDIETINGQKGRPRVFVKTGETTGRADLISRFVEDERIEGLHWVDVYLRYIDVSNEEGVKPLSRKDFTTQLAHYGYEKKQSPVKFTNSEGVTERHRAYYMTADDKAEKAKKVLAAMNNNRTN